MWTRAWGWPSPPWPGACRPRRHLAFIPLPHYFQPDHLALVLRRDKVLAPYKEAFINLLFGDTMLR